ncbi:ArnT family glycosyltransferase [Desulfosudis oleivorans]|uniref:ArnT family glycosyltransferase n=1 Tax=Desulfosudis oleivorans TaxID=181663 RepID=UPI0000ED85C5|nr:glycosyltransferase family 39 protein [Desulfosudis oleivorans]
MIFSAPCDDTAAAVDTGGSWRLVARLLLAGGLLLATGCIVILASVPPVSRDALIHHLAVPKMYLRHGGLYEIASMHFSYFPMNMDLLYLVPLYFKIDIAAKYVHFLFALFCAGLIYRYLRQTLNRNYGLLGALFFLTLPVIVKLSVTVYVDLGLIFFSWASLYLIIQWHDAGFPPRRLILAGIACGLALGTKYNGLLLLPILGTLIPILYASEKNRAVFHENFRLRYKNAFAGLGWSAIFIVIALILFSPWMIRNMVWKGNPVYPLYNSVFNPPAQPVFSETVEKEETPAKNAFWMRRHVYKESFWQTLSIPVRAFFQGQDDNPRYFDGRLNPFLLLLSLAAFIRARQPCFPAFTTHRTVLALFALLFILFVLFQTDFRIRYMGPAIPPLVVLSVFGIRNLSDLASRQTGAIKKAGQAAVTAVVLLALFLNGHYVYSQFSHIRPQDYLSGAVDRGAYISRFRREYPVIAHANKVLPADARVLCLSIGDRTYYLDRDLHLAEDFYDKTGGRYSEADVINKLTRYNTTHVIIDRGVLFDWLRTLPTEDRAVFLNVFKNNTRVLYEENNVLLLELALQ